MTPHNALEARIANALAAADANREAQFVALDVAPGAEDPLAFAVLPIENRFYLERPNEGLRVLALGCRAAIDAEEASCALVEDEEGALRWIGWVEADAGKTSVRAGLGSPRRAYERRDGVFSISHAVHSREDLAHRGK